MTTAAVMALKENQFVRHPLNLQGETAQRDGAKGSIDVDVIGTNDFASNVGDSLGEVHVDEASSPNHAESHGSRTQ
tara:strand:- start:1318 stop:1545 length:228 start_codon:yes stop_codon:yes gene_type:complete